MLRDWLRGRFGFDGVIISDYNAIAELIRHGIAADLAEAAALALKAGVDIDMMADAYRRGLPIALKRGAVSVADIDQSVRRVLLLKERLGLFEDPYRRGKNPESPASRTQRRHLARQVAGAFDGHAEERGRCAADCARCQAPGRDRSLGKRVRRNARGVVGCGSPRGSSDGARGCAQRVAAGADSRMPKASKSRARTSAASPAALDRCAAADADHPLRWAKRR